MTLPVTVLAIDPGSTGAVAALDVGSRELVWVEDMPTVNKMVDGGFLAELMEREPRAPLVIEQVGSFGKSEQGSPHSVGQLMCAYGVALGVAGALRRPITFYRPQEWKGALGLTSDKERSRAMALNLWPQMGHLFRRKSDADRAEAALLGLLHVDRLRRATVHVPTADPW